MPTIRKKNGSNNLTITQEGYSYFSEELDIVGHVFSRSRVEVAGRVSGDVTANTVELASTARVRGDVKARELTIDGNLTGSFVAEKATLKKNARILADFEYGDLSVEAGAVIDGHATRLVSWSGDDESGCYIPEGSMVCY